MHCSNAICSYCAALAEFFTTFSGTHTHTSMDLHDFSALIVFFAIFCKLSFIPSHMRCGECPNICTFSLCEMQNSFLAKIRFHRINRKNQALRCCALSPTCSTTPRCNFMLIACVCCQYNLLMSLTLFCVCNFYIFVYLFLIFILYAATATDCNLLQHTS